MPGSPLWWELTSPFVDPGPVQAILFDGEKRKKQRRLNAVASLVSKPRKPVPALDTMAKVY
jgi:hypothetical protein